MIDPISMQQIGEGLSALKNALDIATIFVGNRKKSGDDDEAEKLRAALIEARSLVLQMQDGYAALLEREKELEDRVVQLESWEEDKRNYQPAMIAPGVHARVYAPKGQPTEPIHWLCETCFQEGKKSKLQAQPQEQQSACKCYACGAIYYLGPPRFPQTRIR